MQPGRPLSPACQIGPGDAQDAVRRVESSRAVPAALTPNCSVPAWPSAGAWPAKCLGLSSFQRVQHARRCTAGARVTSNVRQRNLRVPMPSTDPTALPLRQFRLRKALGFLRAASQLPGTLNIAPIGSSTTEKLHPKDIDLLLTVGRDLQRLGAAPPEPLPPDGLMPEALQSTRDRHARTAPSRLHEPSLGRGLPAEAG